MRHRVRHKYRSPNHSSRNGMKIDLIVLHHTAGGSYAGIRSWLCNPASSVSCHDLIGKPPAKGTYYCDRLVPLSRSAWHAGRGRHDLNADGRIAPAERMLNSRSYGLELLNRGDGKDPWPDEQIKFAARQVRRIKRRYGVPVRNIVDHEMVSLSGKIDLRREFPAARFMWYVEHGITARIGGTFYNKVKGTGIWRKLSAAYRKAGKRIKYTR